MEDFSPPSSLEPDKASFYSFILNVFLGTHAEIGKTYLSWKQPAVIVFPCFDLVTEAEWEASVKIPLISESWYVFMHMGNSIRITHSSH